MDKETIGERLLRDPYGTLLELRVRASAANDTGAVDSFAWGVLRNFERSIERKFGAAPGAYLD